MSEVIIDRDEYYERKGDCTTPDEIQAGQFFLEFRKLHTPDEERFARELFVKILAVTDMGGFHTLRTQELGDDGRELPGADREIIMATDGTILPSELIADSDRGFLFCGTEPSEDGFNRTKEELKLPALVERRVKQWSEEAQQPPSVGQL